jgi:hypothetical protein
MLVVALVTHALIGRGRFLSRQGVFPALASFVMMMVALGGGALRMLMVTAPAAAAATPPTTTVQNHQVP